MSTPNELALPAVVIAGPTASGKSELALQLAQRVGGEIISVDSMQVYRGLDIGTAKPSPKERLSIPHHLIDVVDLNESFDAARFAESARRVEVEIRSRGKVPILCGGTGLYLRAYFEGLGNAPASDPGLRAALETIPLPELLDELARKDPVMFETIDRRNPRRVVRAIEVIRLTGKPFSAQRAARRDASIPSDGQMSFALQRDPADLHARIERRVEQMFANGLVDETRSLLAQGLEENETAMQAIGYRQVVEHLRRERTLAETIELVKIRTRQFAKRQMTWFRKQASFRWIALERNSELSPVVLEIESALRRIAEKT